MTIFESTDIAAIRNVALVGASATGKTTLTEALLLRAGALKTAGCVERGSTVSDHDPLEKRVQHSLNTAVVNCLHDGVRIQLLDTPGAIEFVGQSLPALEAVDVTKRYGPVHALDGANLTIARGEMVYLAGPSGAGKSTLLKLIAAIERPSSGSVTVSCAPASSSNSADRAIPKSSAARQSALTA